MLKKKISLFLMALFLFPTLFITNQTANANPMLASELVKQEASKYCSSLALLSDPTLEFNDYDFEDSDLTIIPEDKYNELFQNEEESNQLIPNEENIDIYAAKPPMFKEQIARSKAGSRVVLPTIAKPQYGYCHIYKYHMSQANYKQGHTVTIGGERKSQFMYAHASNKAMDIAMEVINSTPNLNCKKPRKVRCTKEGYSKTAGVNSRVVIHRGSDWGGYNQHDFVIISLFPVFK